MNPLKPNVEPLVQNDLKWIELVWTQLLKDWTLSGLATQSLVEPPKTYTELQNRLHDMIESCGSNSARFLYHIDLDQDASFNQTRNITLEERIIFREFQKVWVREMHRKHHGSSGSNPSTSIHSKD